MRSPRRSPSSALLNRPTAQRRKSNALQRQLRYLYYRFIRLQSTPGAIARGLASGVFAGCFPLFGLQTIIGVAIAAIVRGNKILAAAGTWVSNPLTYVPLFAFNFHLGETLLGLDLQVSDLSLTSWDAFADSGQDFIVSLFVGSFVVGLGAAIASYGLGLWLAKRVKRYRHRRR